MRLILSIVVILGLGASAYSQSGRRPKEVKVPVTPPEANETTKPKPASLDPSSQVSSERNEDYRCSDDGTLARLLATDQVDEQAVSLKRVDAQAILNFQAASVIHKGGAPQERPGIREIENPPGGRRQDLASKSLEGTACRAHGKGD